MITLSHSDFDRYCQKEYQRFVNIFLLFLVVSTISHPYPSIFGIYSFAIRFVRQTNLLFDFALDIDAK